jgi:hypothetical protein
LLLADGGEHVTWPGDMRKIDLGLDLVSRWAAGTCSLGGRMAFRRRATQFCTYLLRLVFFQRTGMGLLLADPDFRKYIENGFTFDFQLPCQIVDSNLTHPPFLLLRLIR